MNIYKLQYQDRESAITDLKNKGHYINDQLELNEGIHAIVLIGQIQLEDESFEDSFSVDIMADIELEFDNIIEPNNPKHTFAGF